MLNIISLLLILNSYVLFAADRPLIVQLPGGVESRGVGTEEELRGCIESITIRQQHATNGRRFSWPRLSLKNSVTSSSQHSTSGRRFSWPRLSSSNRVSLQVEFDMTRMERCLPCSTNGASSIFYAANRRSQSRGSSPLITAVQRTPRAGGPDDLEEITPGDHGVRQENKDRDSDWEIVTENH